MKILVGIMFTIENEYDMCIQSIQSQTYKEYEYFIVKNLGNKKAHDKLYQTFMENRSEFNLFIKIDADMVLRRNTFFLEAVNYFDKNPEVDDLQIAIDDFYTNGLIYGLHVYSNRMKWTKNKEQVFVDWPDEKHNHINDDMYLAPAAVHCPDPNKYQAFHYGLHKAVKVTQEGRNEVRVSASRIHYKNLKKMIINYWSNNDIRLAFSIIGAYEAIRGRFEASHVDYDNPYAHCVFSNWNSESENVIHFKAKTITIIFFILNPFLLEIILFRRFIRGGVSNPSKNNVLNIIRLILNK